MTSTIPSTEAVSNDKGMVMSKRQIIDMGAAELAEMIKDRKLTSTEITEAFIRRIEEVDPRLNAIVVPLFDEARTQAAEADRAVAEGRDLKPLNGVPVTIKEQYNIKGTPTTLGLENLADNVYDWEGLLVKKLRDAGAVFLGKTNVPQLLIAHETDNPLYGRTNNPWNLSRTPGGSSGGEAAIVSARGSPLGLGGDFGGSIRVPSHFSGIAGLKPTTGRLALSDVPVGIYGAGQEAVLFQGGPMARRVDDLVLAMEVMVEEGESDNPTLIPPVPWNDPGNVELDSMRVGMYTDDGFFPPSPALRRVVKEVSEALGKRGVTVVPFQPQGVDEGMRLYMAIVSADGGAGMKKALDGAKPIPAVKGVIQASSTPKILRPLIMWIMERKGLRRLNFLLQSMGKRSTAGYWDLVKERTEFRRRFQMAMDESKIDAIITPPYGLVATPHGKAGDLVSAASYTMIYNLLGLPAGVVPVSMVNDDEETDRPSSTDPWDVSASNAEKGTAGLPVGVQVVGRYWREDVVLALMKAIEADFRDRPDYPSKPPAIET
jgi:fatty acid amide hydrolase